MKRISPRRATTVCLVLFIVSLSLAILSVPAYSADTAIARLTSFSGTVLIKSNGSWGVQPEEGLALYSGDKVVTRTGIATITFNDGAVMEIKANSNLLIKETEDTTSLARGVGAVKRQVRLLMGKLFFRSGRGTSTSTTLETTTMVCGLRGTAGVLSIDAAGVTYLQFSEGGGDTIGDFIAGVAPDVPAELADLNPAQRAAFVAAAAADQARRAAEKLASGEIADAEAALAAANAAEAAAQEAKAAAEAMLNNPDPTLQNEALSAIAAAEAAIEAAKAAMRQAIDSGATGDAVGIVPSGLEAIGFDVEQIEDFLNGGDDDSVFGDSYGVLGDPLKQVIDNFTSQGNESDILPLDTDSEDSVPPVIEVTATPAAFSNSSTPAFAFYANEYVVYSYILDGGSEVPAGVSSGEDIATFELSDLSEGAHTLVLIAKDVGGNTTSQTFSWVTDLTAPDVSLTVSPGDPATLIASLNNSEPGKVDYVFTDANGIIPPYDFYDGTYSVNVTATDQAGNSSTTTFNFTLKNVALEGSVVGSGSAFSGTASGTASVIYDDNWGGWSTDMSGSWYDSHTGTTFSLVSGEYNEGTYPDYLDRSAWISLTSGDLGSGTLSGSTDFIMLDHTSITRGTGAFSGTYSGTDEGTWAGTDTGSGLINKTLDMAGYWESWYPYHYTNLDSYSGSSGLAGVTANGDDFDYALLGYYYIPSISEPYIEMNYVWDNDEDNTSETSALAGTIWEGGQIKGLLAATYDEDETDNAGIFYEELSGEYYEGIGPYTSTGMWLSQGTITPVEMLSDITSSGRYIDYDNYPDSYSLYFTDFDGEGNVYLESGYYPTGSGNGVSIANIVKNTSDESIDMVFGAWSLGLVSGHYSYLPGDGWSLLLNDDYEQSKTFDTVAYMLVGGTGYSTWDDSTNEISASVAGSWADLTDLITGVYGGSLIGTFDATDYVWQAVAAGSLIDTKTFLDMAATDEGRAKLAQLDIPCVEIGNTTLSGGYTPATGGGEVWNVTMDSVTFFAYSTGADPKIWATSDVSGTFIATPSADQTAALSSTSGSSFSANFTMDSWGSDNWAASIDGIGQIARTDTTGTFNAEIEGGAAGSYTITDAPQTGAGIFSGTASGVTIEYVP